MPAIRGYHSPTSLVYSSTLSGLTWWNTIECTYLPRARTCEKDFSISWSICRPSLVPYISEEIAPFRFDASCFNAASRSAPVGFGESEPNDILLATAEAVPRLSVSREVFALPSDEGVEDTVGAVEENADVVDSEEAGELLTN